MGPALCHMRDLSPQPGIEPMTPAVEVPRVSILFMIGLRAVSGELLVTLQRSADQSCDLSLTSKEGRGGLQTGFNHVATQSIMLMK